MTSAELVVDLSRLGVKLWVDGDQLRFKAPQGALTPELKARLREQKGELVNFLCRVRESLESSEAPPIRPVARRGDVPLSYAQERLWIIDQWESNAAYNIFDEILIEGRINPAALEQSLNEIIRRHETLRTTFVICDRRPVQRIAPTRNFSIRLINLDGLSGPDRDSELSHLVLAEIARPFNLAQGPLLRVWLFRLEAERHVLLFNLHHIISDGWSTGVLIKELAAFYKAFTSGHSSPLPELSVQYADYAQWQREWMNGDRLENHLRFWKERLEGAPASLDLPSDRRRPPVRTSRGAAHQFTLPADLSAEVRRLSQQERVTPFMVLLAAWKTLLWRYAGQDDIVVGSPHANRNRTEIEDLIGFFVNTLVLRTNLSGHLSFQELLARVRETTISAQAHQDLPFEKLVEEIQPDRDPSRTPLFQVVFVFQNAPMREMEAPGLILKRLDLPTETSKFDLSLTITDAEPSLPAVIEYSTDLFEGATIRRMLTHFQNLLKGAVADPGQRLSELPLLTEVERRQLLEWNRSGARYPAETCLHQLFEAQVAQTPNAVAVAFEGARFSYQQLNARANQLGRHLRALGVGPDVLVGLYLDRSLDLVVAMLAVLKAGGAYLPLDLAYPPDRLAFMLEDSQTTLLITKRSRVEDRESQSATLDLQSLILDPRVRVICIDGERELIERQSVENPTNEATANNLAYVIYTSGSTGRPKGALVTHANVVRLFSATQDWYHFDERDVWTLFHSYAFDFSVWELWGALLHGGRLVIVPYWVSRSPEAFHELLRREQVTVLNQTPSAFRQLIRTAAPPSVMPSVIVDEQTETAPELALRLVIFGGEALELQSLKPWFDRHGDERPQLVNMYGITETTVHVSFRPIRATDLEEGRGSVIGGAIPDLEIYVLDGHLRPAPIGVPGEMYVGGAGVARGYLNRPELTAERFIPDPFGGAVGARLYRTGDLARYLADGDLEYLGRTDHQVKIRGFRIELGEIEASLNTHPLIGEAAVLVREDSPGEKRLVAYLVTKPETAPSISELREFLKQKLPEYMTPAAFVALDALPLTENGKLDRRALPAPDAARPELEEAYAAPRNAREELLAEIWASVLNVDRVGIHDNFFELGGHSLLGTQLMSRVNEGFHVNLPLRVLFESPTVAGLTERIESALVSGEKSAIPPIKIVSREEPLPLSYAQENLWLYEQLAPGTPTYTTCRSGRVWGLLNPIAVEEVVNGLLQRHEPLRTSYTSIDGTPFQIINPHHRFQLPLVDLSGLSKADREEMALRLSNESAQRPLPLTEPTVARAHLLRLDREEHVFVLAIHHIAYDLWSGGILLGEIERAYLAYSGGEQLRLPPLPIQYADFAVWQRNYLQGEILERQFSYWGEKLKGLSAMPLELPTDRPRPAIETMRGAIIHPKFPKGLSDEIRSLAMREGVTQFVILLAVFQTLLNRYTRQDDIATGSVITNRNRVELEDAVGFFDNTIVLRSDASGHPSFREFLRRVRDTALGAHANPHLPFDLLVKELQPERASNRTPLIQAMFVFLLNYPAMERELANLKVVPYNLNSGKAGFDLFLGLHESERGIVGELGYNCDLFDETTIERMNRHFERLLEAVTTNPEQRLIDLPLLTATERTELLAARNDTQRAYPIDKLVHELFEEQVGRTPDSVAVVFEAEHLTYGQLNLRANQVAHYLRRRGASAEVRVGICMSRSIEMIVGIVGILKTGAAYVPLDPNYPSERVAFMLKDAGAPILFTEEWAQPLLDGSSAERVTPDSDWEEIISESAANPGSMTDLDSLAYVIYTSGSTGQPRGVGITHRSAVSFLNWAHEIYPREMLDGLLAATSICFDLSIYELFLPLCFGGRIILVENVLALPNLISKQEVTLINSVPSVIRELLNNDALPPSIRTMNLAGEALPADLVRQIYNRSSIEHVYNLYGPSETTTYSTFGLIPENNAGAPPIGQPIANTQVYVLDREMNPAPVGVYGELYIGGIGLARGYLNRPGPTAEKFMANPFSAAPGARMYRTGDQVRWLTDGNLEFLGRIDHQIKMRGFRIELGEIEAVLASHPAVREAVVTVVEDIAQRDKRLVAYVVFRENAHLSNSELRAYLQEKLPEYMAPSAYVTLEELPLTPSGKLNRRALPMPEAASAAREQSLVAPRDDIELRLVRLWEKLFDAQRVSIRDSFFDLGGHSLLAVKLATQIRKQFGRDLPPSVLLQNSTIERLASFLRQEAILVNHSALVAFQSDGEPNGGRPPFFCVHPVGGNVICYAELARQLGPEQPFYAFQTPQPGEGGKLNTIENLAAHYLEYLPEIQPRGPYRLGGWSMGGVIAFEMARRLVDRGEEVELVALIDSFAPSGLREPENLSDQVLITSLIEDLEGLSGRSYGLSPDSLRQATRDEALRVALDRMKSLDLAPRDFGLSELCDLFEVYQANLMALMSYNPQRYSGRVTLFKARPSISEQEPDSTLGWSRLAAGGVEVHEMETNHYSIIAEPCVRSLAARLNEKLGGGRLWIT